MTRRLMVDGVELADRCLEPDDVWGWYYRRRRRSLRRPA